MNTFFRYKWELVGAFAGAAAGLAYWYFVGCANGTCAISSVWYRSMLYFAVMGVLVGNMNSPSKSSLKK